MHGKCQAKTVRYVKLLTEGRASAYSKAHRMARQNDTDALSPPASRTASLAVPDAFWRKRWPAVSKLVAACTHPRIARRPNAREAAAVLARVLS